MVIWEAAKIFTFIHIPYSCKVEQLAALHHHGMRKSKMEM